MYNSFGLRNFYYKCIFFGSNAIFKVILKKDYQNPLWLPNYVPNICTNQCIINKQFNFLDHLQNSIKSYERDIDAASFEKVYNVIYLYVRSSSNAGMFVYDGLPCIYMCCSISWGMRPRQSAQIQTGAYRHPPPRQSVDEVPVGVGIVHKNRI